MEEQVCSIPPQFAHIERIILIALFSILVLYFIIIAILASNFLPFNTQTYHIIIGVIFVVGVLIIDGIAIGMTFNGIRIYRRIGSDTRRRFHKLKVFCSLSLTEF